MDRFRQGDKHNMMDLPDNLSFVYEVENLSASDMDEINHMRIQRKDLNSIASIINKGNLRYVSCNNKIFAENILLIDSLMEKILSEMIICCCQNRETNCHTIANILEDINPLKYRRKGMYEYKIGKFLLSFLQRNLFIRNWNGQYENIGVYDILNRNDSTCLDTIYHYPELADILLRSTDLIVSYKNESNVPAITITDDGKIYITLVLDIQIAIFN